MKQNRQKTAKLCEMENEISIPDERWVMRRAFLSKSLGVAWFWFDLVFKCRNGSVGLLEHSHKTCHPDVWFETGSRHVENRIWNDSSLMLPGLFHPNLQEKEPLSAEDSYPLRASFSVPTRWEGGRRWACVPAAFSAASSFHDCDHFRV